LDIQAYISSGAIEAYIAGLATEEEAEQLVALCKVSPEVLAAYNEAQETMNAYVAAHEVAPPPQLKQQIWSALQPAEPAVVRSMRQAFNRWKIVAAAAILLFAISFTFNLLFNNRLNEYKERVLALQSLQEQSFTQNKIYKAKLDNLQSDLSLMQNATFRKVPLQGIKGYEGMLATVLWNAQSKDVYLSLNNMPELPAGKQFQLWAIVDGKPVDAGLYAANENHFMKMKAIAGATTFAITIEQKGGSPVPTLTQMVVAGNV
jgi:anti-sigma-K factor RskA